MKKNILFCLYLCFFSALKAQTQTAQVATAGTLSEIAKSYLNTVTNLTITGTIDKRDFITMRDSMPNLAVLNLSDVSITAYEGEPANTIPANAFFSNTRLKLSTIVFPKNIVGIRKFAFQNCSNLKNLNIPDGVTGIGENAFGACRGLTELKLPSSLMNLGNSAFYSCEGISGTVVIPDGVIKIGEYAFYLNKINEITLPVGMLTIDNDAFGGCFDLKTIRCLSRKPPVLGQRVFTGVSKNMEVYIGSNMELYKNAEWGDFILKQAAYPNIGVILINSKSDVNVTSSESGIVISEKTGRKVLIDNLIGVQVESIIDGDDTVILKVKQGEYLIRTAGKTIKVII